VTGPDPRAVVAAKLDHSIMWAFVVLCIAAIPVLAWRGSFVAATWLAGIVGSCARADTLALRG